MPPEWTRADALREYLTGAPTDGSLQTDPALSLGNHRSSVEALSLGIQITSPIPNLYVLFAGGANPVGAGQLTAIDDSHLTWQPAGATSAGPPATFAGTNTTGIVEANGNPGQYLRVQCTTPFAVGPSTITLSYLADNFFGFDDVSVANATAGISEYRATIVRNEGPGAVGAWQRWVSLLAPTQVSDVTFLPASGTGAITTSGLFTNWPSSGWAQVRTNAGVLKEVIYYISRTSTVLNVPDAGRGLLGTIAVAGSATDKVYSVPGIAIGIDPSGIQAFGSGIQVIGSPVTAPAAVVWNVEVTAAGGLQIGTLQVNEQVGLWMWRQVPAGAIATPLALTMTSNNFNSF